MLRLLFYVKVLLLITTTITIIMIIICFVSLLLNVPATC